MSKKIQTLLSSLSEDDKKFLVWIAEQMGEQDSFLCEASLNDEQFQLLERLLEKSIFQFIEFSDVSFYWDALKGPEFDNLLKAVLLQYPRQKFLLSSSEEAMYEMIATLCDIANSDRGKSGQKARDLVKRLI